MIRHLSVGAASIARQMTRDGDGRSQRRDSLDSQVAHFLGLAPAELAIARHRPVASDDHRGRPDKG